MATDIAERTTHEEIGEINKYDFRTESKYVFKARKGLDEEIVRQISDIKDEPVWMRDFRLESLKIFNSKPMPRWGGKINIDFQDIYYYLKPAEHQGKTWDDVPDEIKKTFDRLGIPEAEKKYLSGVKAQFESEVVYGSLQEDLGRKGVIFTDTDTTKGEYSELRAGILLEDHPQHGQQICGPELRRLFRRVVHLCAQGCEDRIPAASLFPHQCREHGPIRADADHRR